MSQQTFNKSLLIQLGLMVQMDLTVGGKFLVKKSICKEGSLTSLSVGVVDVVTVLQICFYGFLYGDVNMQLYVKVISKRQ